MRTLLASLLTLALPATLAAQPAPNGSLSDLSLDQLGTLKVTTVSKQPSEVWRSAAAIVVMTAEDIRRTGATSLPELLRFVPGVQVSRLDSGHWAVGVRGLTSGFSKSLLVLIDGRSVYTPLFGGVFWQTQDTLLEDIDRIEVIRGPGGTVWGANAVNGVINVITKHSRDTLGALASIGTGTVDHGRAAFRYGGQHGDGLHYRLYGAGFTRAAFSESAGGEFDDWRIAQAGGRVDTSWRGGAVTLQGDLYRGEAGDRVALGSYGPPSRLVLQGANQVWGGNVLARWQRLTRDGGGLRLQTYYDRTERRALHFGETRHSLDVDVMYHHPIGRRHHVSVGAGARRSPTEFRAVYPTLSLDRPTRAYWLASTFAQDEVALVSDRLWMTVGSKFEYNNNSGMEVQPSARLLWRPDATQSLWLAASRAVRTPSSIDTDLRLTAFVQPNPPLFLELSGRSDFQAETLVGFEAGYRRLVGSQLYLDVAGFYNDYADLAGYGSPALTVERQPVPHVLASVAYVNSIRGTTSGVEVSPDWRPIDWLQVKAAYALLAIDMETRPGTIDASNIAHYEGSSPQHQGSVRVSLLLPRRIGVDLTHRFAARLMSGRVPAYQTADARAECWLSDRVSVAVGGANLLQPRHLEYFRDDGPDVRVPRSAYVSLTWRQ
jgi:iron complex outermembrane receptor protein